MQPKIAVVEDEEALSVLLRYNLEAEGYEVETILRGDEACESLRVIQHRLAQALLQRRAQCRAEHIRVVVDRFRAPERLEPLSRQVVIGQVGVGPLAGDECRVDAASQQCFQRLVVGAGIDQGAKVAR